MQSTTPYARLNKVLQNLKKLRNLEPWLSFPQGFSGNPEVNKG